MKLSNAKINWIAWIVSNQFGCLKDFCILEEREKNQINEVSCAADSERIGGFIL